MHKINEFISLFKFKKQKQKNDTLHTNNQQENTGEQQKNHEEDILDFYAKNGYRLRLTDDKRSSHYVYNNQLRSALKTIEYFREGVRWCLLMAQMQSGKTGTYFSVPYIISRNKDLIKELGVDIFDDEINVFLLTSMSDKDLVNQFEGDIVSFTGMEIKRNVIHNNEMQNFLKKSEDEWSDTDLELINKMRKDSIILIDESHHGSKKDQILNRFLENIIGIRASKEFNLLKENNIYVMSISATPMAERVSLSNSIVGKNKKIIPLETTNKYVGIRHFWENDLVKQSFDFNNETETEEFIKTVNRLKGNGYILVRANPDYKKDNIISKLPDSISYKSYNQKTKNTILNNTDINNILNKEPEGKEIIFFNRMLGAGKRINTDNVLMVHDTSNSKSDTTAQSLLGRCCGYDKNKDVLIYCDKKEAESYYSWVYNHFPIEKTPDNTSDLNKASTNSIIGLSDINPIIEHIDDDEVYNDIIKNRNKHEVRKRIIRYLNNEYLNYYLDNYNVIFPPTFYVVSEESDKSPSGVYKKQFQDKKKGSLMHDLGTKRLLNENIGDIVLSPTFNKDTKELVIVLGEIVEPDGVPSIKDVSMQSPTN